MKSWMFRLQLRWFKMKFKLGWYRKARTAPYAIHTKGNDPFEVTMQHERKRQLYVFDQEK